MSLIIPKKYASNLTPLETIKAIQKIKTYFSSHLEKELNLQRISAPILLEKNSGMSDVADGHAKAVDLHLQNLNGREFELIRSVTKWKRKILAELGMDIGEGICAEIIALRSDEEMSNIHSFQVDQWDWELVIDGKQREYDFLKGIVEKIYSVLKETEKYVAELFPEIKASLPQHITFFNSEDLIKEYPGSTPQERELHASEEHGAIFIVGIGHKLSNGEAHGYRAPDFDDWSSPNKNGTLGLNGDLIIWNPVINQPLELSSMGIRVDAQVLKKQVGILNCPQLMEYEWHQQLLNGNLPLSIGGGIGISRTCMFLLRKAHIGEVQYGVWAKEMEESCFNNGIQLLK